MPDKDIPPSNLKEKFGLVHAELMAACNEALTAITGHRYFGEMEEHEASLLLLEAYEYFYTTIMIAFEWYLHADPRRPRFQQANTVFRRGLDNPDVLYLQAVISPDEPYRIRGRTGDAAEFSFQIWDNTACATVSSLHGNSLATGPGGEYEILVGPIPPSEYPSSSPRNYLPQGNDKKGDMVLVRYTYPEWDESCDTGEIHIEW